jgi:hypothetical protein
LECCLLAEEIG